MGRSSEPKTPKNAKKVKWGRTDGRMDGETDRQTVRWMDRQTDKAGSRVAWHASKNKAKYTVEGRGCI